MPFLAASFGSMVFLRMGKYARRKGKTIDCNSTGDNTSESLRITDDKELSEKSVNEKTRNFNYFFAGIVSLITFLVYLPCLRNEFLNWDDNIYVYENPFIRSFNTTLFKWAFLGFYASNWHPLTWISHAIDYAIWGLNPFGHHLTNVVLHTVNTFIVVLLVLKLIENYKGATRLLDDRRRLLVGGVTGFLFGLHPLHVESVAWVAERKDLLCASFFLLSIMVYAKYMSFANKEPVEKRATSGFLNKYYLFSLCFFALALLSKPMAVSLPFVLLILDWYPFNRIQSISSFRSAFIGKLPFILLSLGSSVLTILAQKEGGAMNMKLMEIVPLATRVLVAAKSLIVYLGKMILPINFIPYYPYPKDASLFSLEYLSAVVLVVGITAACVAMVKKQKLWLSVWAYYVATLIPVIGLVQVGGQSMADRYSYLPSLGPFFIAGLGMAWVSMMVYSITKKWGQSVKFVMFAATIFLSVSTVNLTVNQLSIWKNSFTLWTYVIENRPDEIPVAYNNRGLIFIEKGQLDQAKEDLDKAIALNPYYYEAYYHRGMIFMNLGQYGQALKDLDKAIGLNPLFYSAYNNRGMVLGNMGQLDKAIADFTTAISLNRTDGNAFLNRGLLFLQVGRNEIAVSDLRNACELGNDFGCKTLQYLGNKGN